MNPAEDFRVQNSLALDVQRWKARLENIKVQLSELTQELEQLVENLNDFTRLDGQEHAIERLQKKVDNLVDLLFELETIFSEIGGIDVIYAPNDLPLKASDKVQQWFVTFQKINEPIHNYVKFLQAWKRNPNNEMNLEMGKEAYMQIKNTIATFKNDGVIDLIKSVHSILTTIDKNSKELQEKRLL